MEWRSDQSRTGDGRQNLRSGDANRPAASAIPLPLPWGSDHGAPRLVPANAGDHKLIHALLRVVHQAPSYEDFSTWLDEPAYEPADRLLIKKEDQIIGHVYVHHRLAWFHGVQVPVGGVQDLAALPEYRQAGYERVLLEAAQEAMLSSKAVLSLVRSDRPELLRSSGWTDVQGQGYTRASVNDILAHLCAQAARWPRRRRKLRIRPWRHVELDAVRDVYDTAAARLWGALHRPAPYWQWLVGRKAHGELIVAIDGPDEWEDLESESRIVGYAVTHASQVIELCCLPDYERAAAPRLLARACQDAIERDFHTLSLHTPASDPLHELIVTAGGTWCGNGRSTGETLLVKLLDPAQWIERMYPVLRERAKTAGIHRPCEIGFDVGDRRFRLVLTRRSSRLAADETAPGDVQCDRETFAALLVGNLRVARACDGGLITVPDNAVLARLAALFPPALFWQSPFDLLRF